MLEQYHISTDRDSNLGRYQHEPSEGFYITASLTCTQVGSVQGIVNPRHASTVAEISCGWKEREEETEGKLGTQAEHVDLCQGEGQGMMHVLCRAEFDIGISLLTAITISANVRTQTQCVRGCRRFCGALEDVDASAVR